MMAKSSTACTYERYHIHHGRIPCNEKQERILNNIGLGDVSRNHLLHYQLADEVVLWGRSPQIDQLF